MIEEGEEQKLTPAQLRKVEVYLRDAALLHRAVGYSLTKRRRSPNARRFARGQIKAIEKAIAERLRSAGIRETVKELICKKLEWCKLRKGKLYKLIVACVAALLPLLLSWEAAIANIVFMVKRYMFDRLCDCPEDVPSAVSQA
jgi:hypothetical protein